MSEQEVAAQAAASGVETAGRLALPLWKKLLVTLSGLFVATGAGLTAMESKPAEPVPETRMESASDSQALLLSEDGTLASEDYHEPGPAAAEGDLPWNRFFLKGGLSLFLGFCVGSVLRAFFKMSVLVVGVVTLAVLGLSQLGVIDVDWSLLQGHWEGLSGTLRAGFASLQGFVASNLPSGGMASLGLLAGIKKS